MTQRIEIFLQKVSKNGFLECDSKNWNFSLWHSQNWTFLFSNMTHRIEHFFSRIWRTELNIAFLEYDAQNFFNMTHRTEHLFLQMTHRTEHLFLQMTHRIECLSLIWSKERIEFLWYDTKEWIFLIWPTEPNTFQHNSKTWTFFSNWLKEVNFFSPSDSKKLTLFDKIWPKGLIFSALTQRTEHIFECDSKNWTFFFKRDSKNWTLFTKGLQELIFSQFFFKDLNPF